MLAPIVALAAVGALWWWNRRPTLVAPGAELPEGFPAQGFSHETFEALLRRFVRDGRVDYGRWKGDREARAALDRYLAAVARFSPDGAPERFPTPADAAAYWIYAYNACVIRAVLDRWPIASVTEVKAPLELVKGLGFFYTLEFVLGGERFNLFDLERKKIVGPKRDPRAHFLLNCGSGGCPVLRPELPAGAALEPLLAEAARDFVTDPRNVHVDHDRRRIELSMIFRWHAGDFVAEVRRRGLPTDRGVVAYLLLIAPEALARELERAEGYDVGFREYDWAINGVFTGG